MKVPKIGLNVPAVVVLGAGATRGASFVSETTGRVLPPLDFDFFTQIQRMSKPHHRERLMQLIKEVATIFGGNFELTMEGLFTRIEQLSDIHKNLLIPSRPVKKFAEMREEFIQVLAAVLEESIGKQRCLFHQTLVECLDTRDAIVSFNYDWLIDDALRYADRNIWNPKIGYGLRVCNNGGLERWAKVRKKGAVYPKKSLQLYKMHGSLTWFPFENRHIKLRQKMNHQNGQVCCEIVPPEMGKQLFVKQDETPYRDIWSGARLRIKNAKGLVFIGYSFPSSDLLAESLFMVDQNNASHLDYLIIVNPEREVRKRIRRIIHKRLQPKTSVLSFNRFSELADFFGCNNSTKILPCEGDCPNKKSVQKAK